MQAVLNFKKEELPVLREFLAQFEQQEPKPFELGRCRIQNSSIALFSSGKLLIQGADSEAVKQLVLDSLSVGNELVLGIDEAGRGEDFGSFCISGVLGKTKELREARDSKKVSDLKAKKKIVQAHALSSVTICFPAKTIDLLRTNGLNLNQMEGKAIDWIISFFENSGFSPKRIVVDGNPLPVSSKTVEFIPKGDDLEPVVGAASILAKTTRDESADKEKRKSWKTKV